MTLDKEELYREYFSFALKKAYQYSTNNAQAHDFAQEVMIKVLDRMEDIDPESKPNFDAYCKKAIINRIVDLHRDNNKSNRGKVNAVNDGLDIRDNHKLRDISNEENYRKEMELKKMYGKILEAIDDLPISYGTTMYYYYVHGYKVKEIADILNTGQPTIKSNLYRGRKRVYEQLKDSFKESDIRYVYSLSEE